MTAIVFTFARMNPPTLGHQLLVDTLKKARVRVGSYYEPMVDRYIYLSPTEGDSKNPLSHDERIELVTRAFYDLDVIVSSRKLNDVFACMKHAQDMGYSDVVVVVGSDRFDELNKRLPMYNGNLYNFNSISVIKPALDRDEGSDGVQGVSASRLREAAKLNDYDTFEAGLPHKLRSIGPELMREVRDGCLSGASNST